MSDRRAVSTTLGYVLSLAIASVLVTGLIIAGGEYVDDAREQVVRDELTVIGQQLAADLERADRLVRASDTDEPVTVQFNKTFSNTVTGTSYQISLDPSQSVVEMTTTNPDVTVQVGVRTLTDLEDTTILGGTVQVSYDRGTDRLEVTDV